MKVLPYIVCAVTVLTLATPAISHAALPTCQSASSDPDGDGFGWENNTSCRVASVTSTSTDKPECIDPASDPDGDGFGWENNASCRVGDTSTTGGAVISAYPVCSSASLDPDNDGYGWENNNTCVVSSSGATIPAATQNTLPTCTSADSDPDGDGFGWENDASCAVVPGAVESTYRSIDTVYPYRPNSAYASVLKKCALISESSESCKLHELPFIGLVNSEPSVANIMDRVLVTHDWMGERFERLLSSSPVTLRRMFQSIAVIVIGADVRPSSYSILNAAMKVDPYYLWMSVAEKATIDPGSDFRSSFGANLRFQYFRDFKKANGRPLLFPSLTDQSERAFADLIEPAVSLLFHELAHAVDFAPSWTLPDMNYDASINSAILNNSSNWLSPKLQDTYPNQSTALTSLAGVRFFDDSPSATDLAFTAVDVGAEFENDGAATFYSYSTIREDFANLVQAAMIKFHYDISLGVYFYDKPTTADPTCKIAWGVMNRIAHPTVLTRAEWAVNRAVATGLVIDSFFAGGAGVEVSDRVGEDLCSQKAKASAPALYLERWY